MQLTRGIYPPEMINKCYFLLIKSNENNVNEKRQLVDGISQKLPDQPKAIVFLLEKRGQLSELPAFDFVTFGVISDNDLIFYRCPNTPDFTAVTIPQLLQSQMSAVCSLRPWTALWLGAHLRHCSMVAAARRRQFPIPLQHRPCSIFHWSGYPQ